MDGKRITTATTTANVDGEGRRRRRRGILTQNKKYRSRTEIIQDILQAARSDGDGVGKTKIMYNAFLSYHQITEYLTILIDNGLLQYDLGNLKFRITEKGLSLLQLCDQIGDLVGEGEQLRW
jgi:predicted transcriptional regulator